MNNIPLEIEKNIKIAVAKYVKIIPNGPIELEDLYQDCALYYLVHTDRFEGLSKVNIINLFKQVIRVSLQQRPAVWVSRIAKYTHPEIEYKGLPIDEDLAVYLDYKTDSNSINSLWEQLDEIALFYSLYRGLDKKLYYLWKETYTVQNSVIKTINSYNLKYKTNYTKKDINLFDIKFKEILKYEDIEL